MYIVKWNGYAKTYKFRKTALAVFSALKTVVEKCEIDKYDGISYECIEKKEVEHE